MKFIENCDIASDVIGSYCKKLIEDGKDIDWVTIEIRDNDKIMTYKEVVDLLNYFVDENEQLKKQIERIDFILDDLNGADYISRDDGIKALNKIDKVIGKR